MSILRRFGVVVLVLALTTTLFGANLAVGAERTVLDAGFVTTALDEEGVYEDLQATVTDRVSAAGANATTTAGRQLPVSQAAILEEAVTPAYLRSQVEANVEGTIGYLHGDREEFVVAVDLRPVKERAGQAVAAELRNMTPAELFGQFEGETIVEAGDLSVPTLGLVGRMAANESAFRDARAEFRASLREAAVRNRTDEAFRTASDDELLGLVVEDYDPDAYNASEKARMVSEREPAIRTALRQEFESAVEAEMDELLTARRASLESAVESSVADADVDPALRDALRSVALLGIDGLTTDVSYDAFRERANDARDDVAVALSAVVLDGLESELPDEMVLTEDLDPGTTDALATARTAVGVLNALAVGLWLVAAALVGALWWLGRSVVVTTVGTGVALLVAGSPVALAARWAAGRLRTMTPADPAGAAAFEAVVPVADRVLSAVALQSAALAVVGLLLVGFGLAVRFDLVPADRLPRYR